MLTMENIDQVVALLAARRPAGEAELDPKAKAVFAVLGKEGFGCQTGNVKRLMEAYLDVKFPEISQDVKLLSVLVPVSSNNGHSYKIDEPVMLVSKTRAIDKTGRQGNNLPVNGSDTQARADVRYATDEEIRSFITPEVLAHLNEFVIVVS